MNAIDCAALDRRLDDGAPVDEPMRTHAATCARCAAMLAALTELDALFAAVTPPRPTPSPMR